MARTILCGAGTSVAQGGLLNLSERLIHEHPHGMNELQALLTKPVRAQALIVVADVVTFDRRESIARFAAANRLAG